MISLSLWVCECVCTVLCLFTQSCPTLCEPVDCSLPGSSVHSDSPGKNTRLGCHALLQGIFPTQGSNPGLPHCRWILYHRSHQGSPRILEWVAYTRLIKTIIDIFFFWSHIMWSFLAQGLSPYPLHLKCRVLTSEPAWRPDSFLKRKSLTQMIDSHPV